MAKDVFLDALDDSDLEFAVLGGQPGDLQQTLKVALEYEAFWVTRVKKLPVNTVSECVVG